MFRRWEEPRESQRPPSPVLETEEENAAEQSCGMLTASARLPAAQQSYNTAPDAGASLPRLLGRTQVGKACTGKGAHAKLAALETVVEAEEERTQRACSKRAMMPLQLDDCVDPVNEISTGVAVRNTFLHIPVPLPTPVRMGSRVRSRSLTR